MSSQFLQNQHQLSRKSASHEEIEHYFCVYVCVCVVQGKLAES